MNSCCIGGEAIARDVVAEALSNGRIAYYCRSHWLEMCAQVQPDTREAFSVAEAARIVGCSVETVYKKIKVGILPAFLKETSHLWIKKADLERFRESY